MKVITAPDNSFTDWGLYTAFLADSIEMGKAERWQDKVIKSLSNFPDDLVIFNPRRESWNPDWVQSINNPNFAEQVNWELKHLEDTQYALFYFDPQTKSPITLMELGLALGQLDSGNKEKIYVACPAGFWRRGNIEIVCDKYEIPLLSSLDELISEFKKDITAEYEYTYKEISRLETLNRAYANDFENGN